MARNDDSGLRAGYVREDDPRAENIREPKPAEEKEQAADVKEEATTPAKDAARSSEKKQTPEASDNATITMQGVSGKKIKGTVKVVKVRKKKKPKQEAPASEDMAAEATASTTTATEVPAAQEAPAEAPTPRKVASGGETRAEAKPAETKPKAEEKAPEQKAPEQKASDTATAADTATEHDGPSIPTKIRGPKPRKLKAGDGTLPTPEEAAQKKAQKEAAAKPAKPSKAESKARPEKAKPAAKKADAPKDEKKEDTPPILDAAPKPRKIGSMKDLVAEKKKDKAPAPAKAARADEKPKPRKISSGKTKAEADKPEEDEKKLSSVPKMGRKIVSGEDTQQGDAKGSLAATAELFAARKAAKEEERERKQRRRNQRQRGGRPSAPFDKDEEERPRRTRSPRGPKPARPSQDLTEVFGKSAQPKRRKFNDGSSHHRRQREWADHSRQQNRGPAGKELSRQLQERANRIARDGMAYEYESRRRRRRKPKHQRGQDKQDHQPVAQLTHVKLPETLTVKEFAEAIKKTAAEVISHLMKNGVMATANQELDFDTATIIADEFGITTEKIEEVTEEDILFDDSEDVEENLRPRPPVVAVMGHVDHGKTSLLDYIRKTEVTDDEAGGITQHIGAYMVTMNDKKITFLDTPGHEAFTTMRQRGASATDIAILVVAADDGVMPQTVEAINHAKAADTKIIVAINKIDKPTANVDRVKQELTKYELIAEEWGGDTIMVPVSALTGEGVDELLEMVLLTAEVMELRADPTRQAKGVIIEAKLDRSRGALATLLVQRGTLRVGDTIVTSSVVGNIRAMTDATGRDRKEAGPSVPVEILGLPEVPEAGELFYEVEDERTARQLAERRREERREEDIGKAPKTTLDSLFSQIEAGEIQDLNVIVKADVVGSVEALTQSLEKLSNDEVNVQVIHGAAGAINESDIRLASVSNAIVIGFNVRPTAQVTDLARDEGVDIRLYSVIYNAIDDMEKAMKGMLAPEEVEEVLGHAEIRETFKSSSVGTIGGAYVTDGKIQRNSKVRLLRDGVVIYDGELGSLRRFKDDVREVNTNYECGLSIERFNDIKVGDVVESYVIKEVER